MLHLKKGRYLNFCLHSTGQLYNDFYRTKLKAVEAMNEEFGGVYAPLAMLDARGPRFILFFFFNLFNESETVTET